jgi:hypothetical protein
LATATLAKIFASPQQPIFLLSRHKKGGGPKTTTHTAPVYFALTFFTFAHRAFWAAEGVSRKQHIK